MSTANKLQTRNFNSILFEFAETYERKEAGSVTESNRSRACRPRRCRILGRQDPSGIYDFGRTSVGGCVYRRLALLPTMLYSAALWSCREAPPSESPGDIPRAGKYLKSPAPRPRRKSRPACWGFESLELTFRGSLEASDEEDEIAPRPDGLLVLGGRQPACGGGNGWRSPNEIKQRRQGPCSWADGTPWRARTRRGYRMRPRRERRLITSENYSIAPAIFHSRCAKRMQRRRPR